MPTLKLENNVNETDLTDQNESVNLKPLIKNIALVFRKNHVSYNQSKYIFHEVRKACELESRQKGKRELPEIPSDEEMARLVSCSEANFTHWVMIQLLKSTGMRVSECVNIRCQDVFLNERKIFIKVSKTGNRFVLFPEAIRMNIKQLMEKKKPESHVFTSRQHKKFSRQGVWLFIKKYAVEAKISKRISPHMFRHYFLTKLSNVMNEAEIMVLSGHARKETLGLNQHMGIEDLREKYERVF